MPDGRCALILRVDDAAAKHIARDGVDHIFLLTPNLVDIAREQRHAAHQSLVDPLGEEVAMHIVGVQDRQLFQVLHILPPYSAAYRFPLFKKLPCFLFSGGVLQTQSEYDRITE